MIFRPELAYKVVVGVKTVTRRLPSDNPRSPWWRERCALQVGRDYSVQSGRGVPSLCRVKVISVEMVRLGLLPVAEAEKEGFDDPIAFATAWAAINGHFDPNVMVWRVEFNPPEIPA